MGKALKFAAVSGLILPLTMGGLVTAAPTALLGFHRIEISAFVEQSIGVDGFSR
jgi:hypothetical protein